MLRVGIVTGLLASLAMGCGSSSSAPSTAGDAGAPSDSGGPTGVVPCDASPGLVPCKLSMPVSGAITATLTDNGSCGWGGGSGGATEMQLGADDFFATEAGLVAGHLVEAIAASPPISQDQLGPLSVAVSIRQSLPDGGTTTWLTPMGACTLDVTGNVCLAALQEHALIGTGSCSSPAAPEGDASAGSVTVGNFTFVAHVGP